MKASILTIGDEILIGQIVDTNSASIARHLNNAGIVVWERTSVGDQREQITEAVKRAMNQSDVVILTGGLGPTKDDITKKTLAELFGSRLVCDQTVADHVRRMLEARGIEYNRLNRDQALVPACCTVLFNAHGTAPGMWFEQNGKVVVSLPGVPFEMEHLMTDEVMPRLKARFSLRQIVHRTLITAGLAESMLAEKIADWENALSHEVEIGADPLGNLQRLSNALEGMTGKMADVEQKLSNVEHQLETAKVEVTKPFAQEAELDLVKIAPGAKPPVCKIIDYGKYKYEQTRKEKEAKKKQRTVEIKEVRLSPNIDTNDLNTKMNNAKKFISKGNKVKVTLRFRGREMAHVQQSKHILDDFAKMLEDVAVVEKAAKLEGRNMSMVLTERR